ncbi:MAG: hypothetical protein J6C11_09225 [Spirochaetaceae bacterium]|nr:hypothetical protein [Spirochaetaceae bacterium]
MNKLTFFLLTILIGSSLHAQAPTMKALVPTEWELMNELTEAETKKFMENHKEIFDYCEKISFSHLEGRHFPEQNVCLEETKVFKEAVNGDTFYWVLVPGNRMNDTKEMMEGVSWVPEKHYFLGLVRVEDGRDRLLFLHPTLNIDTDGRSFYYAVRTYQIIKGKDRNKGIIYYENRFRFDTKEVPGTKFNDVRKVKGQPVGFITAAHYYLFEEEPAETEYSEYLPGFALKNWDFINIYASDFLWDLNDPLKYGLQNAFDGNPATSYVENTEDDLFEIKIYDAKYHPLFAIINGYAQNEKLYMDNNRVKLFNYNYNLSDGTLNYQFIKGQGDTKLVVKDFYKGLKYSDTCIAELNMKAVKDFYAELKPEESDWLFGDIDD